MTWHGEKMEQHVDTYGHIMGIYTPNNPNIRFFPWAYGNILAGNHVRGKQQGVSGPMSPFFSVRGLKAYGFTN
jgi:hypothetical protein